MCFTPTLSLATAVVEFILVVVLLLFFKKSVLRNFFAVFIFVLGFYQFTEFMICTSGNPLLWAKFGIITFSFLPAIALHATMRFVKKNANLTFLYFSPIIATIAVLFFSIITAASCGTFFIKVSTVFFVQANNLFVKFPFIIYVFYYFGFLIYAGVLFYEDYQKQRSKIKREIELVELVGISLMAIPAAIFFLILPAFGVGLIPSVLCQFALFVAIAAFIGVYLESKIKKRR